MFISFHIIYQSTIEILCDVSLSSSSDIYKSFGTQYATTMQASSKQVSKMEAFAGFKWAPAGGSWYVLVLFAMPNRFLNLSQHLQQVTN